jgi:hypothetical protein
MNSYTYRKVEWKTDGLDLNKWTNGDCAVCGKKDVRLCYGVCGQCRSHFTKEDWEHHMKKAKMLRESEE